MKANGIFSKVLVLTAMVIVCGFASAQEKDFIHNDVVENGKIKSREIYSPSSSGILSPIKKYEFEYDSNMEVKTKTTFVWNVDKMKWMEDSQTSYGRNGMETTIEYAVWDKSKQSFIPSEKQVFVKVDDVVTQYNYKMNKRSKEWELQKGSSKPGLDNIFAARK